MEDKEIILSIQKLAVRSGEVLVIRVPEASSAASRSDAFDRIVGCLRCLPKDSQPQGILFLPEWVQLDQLKAADLSPAVAQILNLPPEPMGPVSHA